jgi:hypothetical protein
MFASTRLSRCGAEILDHDPRPGPPGWPTSNDGGFFVTARILILLGLVIAPRHLDMRPAASSAIADRVSDTIAAGGVDCITPTG